MSLTITAIRPSRPSASSLFSSVRWIDDYTGKIGTFTPVQLGEWLREDRSRLAFVGLGVAGGRIEIGDDLADEPVFTIRSKADLRPLFALPTF